MGDIRRERCTNIAGFDLDHFQSNEEMMAGGLFAIAEAIQELATSIDDLRDGLGINKANTNMGALELVAKEIKDFGTNMNKRLDETDDAIRGVSAALT